VLERGACSTRRALRHVYEQRAVFLAGQQDVFDLKGQAGTVALAGDADAVRPFNQGYSQIAPARVGHQQLGYLADAQGGVLRRVGDGHHGGVRAGMGHQQVLYLGVELFVFFGVEVTQVQQQRPVREDRFTQACQGTVVLVQRQEAGVGECTPSRQRMG